MFRLFVAIDVPEEHRSALAALQEEDLEARWTPPEQYHLTLRFLGDVPPEEAEGVREALAAVPADLRPTLRSSGLLVFPSRRKPRVLGVGLEEDPALMVLHRRIDQVLTPIGFRVEDRPFRPHITVARLKRVRPQQIRAYLRTYEEFTLGPFPADAFHLYRSILHPTGAEHRILQTYALGKNRYHPTQPKGTIMLEPDRPRRQETSDEKNIQPARSLDDPLPERTAFERAFAAMSAEEQAELHEAARSRALQEDPTLRGAEHSPTELIHAYMREIWKERQE